MDFGSIIGSAAGWLGQQNENESKSRANQQYGQASQEYNDESQAANQRLQDYLNQQTQAGYRGYGNLASALNGPGRTAAGEAGRADLTGRLDAAQASTPAARQTGWAGGGDLASKWGNLAFQKYAPRLAAHRAALGQGAAQAGQQDSDTAAFAQQQQGATNIGRQTTEAQQQEQLMQQFRNQYLQQAASRYGYTGPSQGTYNLQLAGALAGAGANGLNAYVGQNQNPNPMNLPNTGYAYTS